MMRSMMQNRTVSILFAVIVLLAVWKANGGDPTRIADGAWRAIDTVAEMLADIWRHFF